jgi:hypothetical protein
MSEAWKRYLPCRIIAVCDCMFLRDARPRRDLEAWRHWRARRWFGVEVCGMVDVSVGQEGLSGRACWDMPSVRAST